MHLIIPTLEPMQLVFTYVIIALYNAYEIASAIVTRRLTSNEGEFIIDTRFGNIMSDTVDNQKCVNRFPVSLQNNLLVSTTLNITRVFILDSVF